MYLGLRQFWKLVKSDSRREGSGKQEWPQTRKLLGRMLKFLSLGSTVNRKLMSLPIYLLSLSHRRRGENGAADRNLFIRSNMPIVGLDFFLSSHRAVQEQTIHVRSNAINSN